MKKITIICALLFATLSGIAQNQFADYVNYLKEGELIQQPDPKVIQRFEWRMFPKPLEIKKTHNKVVMVFDRREWERMQYMHRKMWLRRGEVHKQIDELEKIRERYKK